jgi:hypothetical protein
MHGAKLTTAGLKVCAWFAGLQASCVVLHHIMFNMACGSLPLITDPSRKCCV